MMVPGWEGLCLGRTDADGTLSHLWFWDLNPQQESFSSIPWGAVASLWLKSSGARASSSDSVIDLLPCQIIHSKLQYHMHSSNAASSLRVGANPFSFI